MMDITGITSVIFHSFVKKMLCCVRFKNGSTGPALALGYGSSESLHPPLAKFLALPLSLIDSFCLGSCLNHWDPIVTDLGVQCLGSSPPFSLTHRLTSKLSIQIGIENPHSGCNCSFKKLLFLGRQIWFVQPYDQPECLKAYLACLRGVKERGGEWKRQDEVKTGL